MYLAMTRNPLTMMKKLNNWQNALFLIGGLLMVIGAGCYCFLLAREVVCWLFLAGACLFAVMQMMQTYEGSELTIRRLKRIQTLADICFIISGMLMVDSVYNLILPLFDSKDGAGYYTYIQYVYNKWVILLLIAALLELYTTHRLDAELKRLKNT